MEDSYSQGHANQWHRNSKPIKQYLVDSEFELADGLKDANKIGISENGKHVYIIGEGDHALSWYERNPLTGAITYAGMLKDGVNGVSGLQGVKDLALTKDGKHLYTTAVHDSTVSWYECNANTGALTFAGMLKDGENGAFGLAGSVGLAISTG